MQKNQSGSGGGSSANTFHTTVYQNTNKKCSLLCLQGNSGQALNLEDTKSASCADLNYRSSWFISVSNFFLYIYKHLLLWICYHRPSPTALYKFEANILADLITPRSAVCTKKVCTKTKEHLCTVYSLGRTVC